MCGSEVNYKIRGILDFFTEVHEQQEMVGIRDPLGLTKEAILVPPHTFFVISLMNGETSISTIQSLFLKQFGQNIDAQMIHELAESLDKKGFLDSPSFQHRKKAMLDAYHQLPMRQASHAGMAYPNDKEELVKYLDDSFKNIEGKQEKHGRLKGLIAPHIDLHRGIYTFANAYNALRNESPPHTVLLLGTAHYGETGPYILTTKGFETPLGQSQIDEDFCNILSEECSLDLNEGELNHIAEHSIEFQVLYLQHIFGSNGPKIVPLLCTSILELVNPGESPCSLPFIQEFFCAANKAINACKGPVLVIAGADMCHVGASFDRRTILTEDFIDQVKQEDQNLLASAVNVDGEAFFDKVVNIQNRNHICSITSIYTLCKLMNNSTTGELINYDMAIDMEANSAVGFAAMNFHSNDA